VSHSGKLLNYIYDVPTSIAQSVAWKNGVRFPTRIRIFVFSHIERLGTHPDCSLYPGLFHGAEAAGMEDTI
jgi:hypothetical protein